MKICYIVSACNPHAARWIEPQIAHGHEVHVISYMPCDRVLPGVANMVDLTRMTNVPKARFLQWGRWLNQYVHQLQPHVLHAHQIVGAGWLGVMARYHPFVVSAWGSDLLVEPGRSFFRRQLVRTVLRYTDILTVPSRLMADIAIQLNFPCDRLHIVPWGVETTVFSPTPDDGRQTRQSLGLDLQAPVLLAPRRVSALYHHHTLLHALQRLIGQHPDLHLVLIRYSPDQAYMAQIEQQIAYLGLDDHVTWLPAQTKLEDMARLYRMADIILSIPASEGYGSTVYEALSCGTPAIISDLPVFKDELIDGRQVIKVPVGDVQGTAAAIGRLLTDHQLYDQLAGGGREAVRSRGTAERLKQVDALYASLISA